MNSVACASFVNIFLGVVPLYPYKAEAAAAGATATNSSNLARSKPRRLVVASLSFKVWHTTPVPSTKTQMDGKGKAAPLASLEIDARKSFGARNV